jgi:multidrug efflux pump subunit AcrB
LAGKRLLAISVYLLAAAVVIALLGPYLGRELFPRVSYGQLLLRFRAPTGTRVETTERLSLDVLRAIQ